MAPSRSGDGGFTVTARKASRFGSGNSVKRVEDDALLRGKGRFVDNLPAAGQLQTCFVRSPHPSRANRSHRHRLPRPRCPESRAFSPAAIS
jgi:hypothetical protein